MRLAVLGNEDFFAARDLTENLPGMILQLLGTIGFHTTSQE